METGDDPRTFVPQDFAVPLALETAQFRLEPLGPEHNEADYAAWTSSIDHIRSTPGFEAESWPEPMSLEENRGDLESHREDFARRAGFTYTVLGAQTGNVIGCVYIYPKRDEDGTAKVQSWVSADHADLDAPLHSAVSTWLRDCWPFRRIVYAAR